ncbi:MAG: hypothetical protein ACTSUX_00635 [Promethearchaeota archaeon]
MEYRVRKKGRKKIILILVVFILGLLLGIGFAFIDNFIRSFI